MMYIAVEYCSDLSNNIIEGTLSSSWSTLRNMSLM